MKTFFTVLVLGSLLLAYSQLGLGWLLAFIYETSSWLIETAKSVGLIGIFLFSFIVTSPMLPLVAPEYIYPVYLGLGTNVFTVIFLSVLGVLAWMWFGYIIGQHFKDKIKVEDPRFRRYLDTYGYVAITALMVFPILPIPIEIASGVAALDLRKYLLAVLIGALIRAAAILGFLGMGMQAVAFSARPYGI